MTDMKLEDFQRICSINELNDNIGRRFILNDIDIAVFLIKQRVFALSNICPHLQTTLIYDGFIEDNYVVCPVHGWKFDLETGKTPSGSNGLRVFETKVVENEVYVKVNQKKFNW
ncbi:MAG: Rieske (2Fe-2S) protein [Ignavibacteriaceae bacterium]|nr:Rieske (2Fe-2S) protein [Ignavibacteriaceae bacterium]